MKKYILSLCAVVFSTFATQAQFDYSLTGRNDVPVKGVQWGVVAGGFTSMMNNRDDIDADQRLDPQMVNFSYGGGLEYIYWFQPSIGVGAQGLFWQGGAAYTGKDSLSGITMSAKTTMTYLKVPVLFHFKSYNRYYPDRRVRFSAMFGPYIGLLSGFDDEITLKDKDNNLLTKTSISGNDYVTGSNGETKGSLSGQIYKPLDLGFVAGFGLECRLWRRTVIALHLRTDIGISNAENNKGLKITYDTDNTKEYDFNPWKGLYAKYNAGTAQDIAEGWESNRPATKNFAVGGFLSVRKYIEY
jgi:hypothetical protein